MFPTLTPIVVMLDNVIGDLKQFMLFYLILIFISAQMFCVIGLGNKYDVVDGSQKAVDETEYKYIGLHLGTIISTLRVSIGDFYVIDVSADLEPAESWMFWISWVFIMGALCIVFLNFIVAEASASYQNVVD